MRPQNRQFFSALSLIYNHNPVFPFFTGHDMRITRMAHPTSPHSLIVPPPTHDLFPVRFVLAHPRQKSIRYVRCRLLLLLLPHSPHRDPPPPRPTFNAVKKGEEKRKRKGHLRAPRDQLTSFNVGPFFCSPCGERGESHFHTFSICVVRANTASKLLEGRSQLKQVPRGDAASKERGEEEDHGV